MKKLRIILFSFIFLFSCSNVFAMGSDSKMNDAFDLDVSANMSMSGDYYIVSIDVTNNNSDFKGILRLVAKNDTSENVGYDMDISIPKNSTKTYTINIPNKEDNDDIEVRIYNEAGSRKLYSEKFRSIYNQRSGVISLGVLSDNYDQLSYMDMGGASVDYDNAKYIVDMKELDAASLPDELDNINILAISDYDTSKLSDETMGLIENWVIYDGGVLFLGADDGYDRVVSGFGLSFQSELSDYTSAYIEYLDYFYYSRKGKGMIAVCSTASDDTDDSREALESLYLLFLDNYNSSNQSYSDKLSYYEMETAQGYMEEPAKTGSGVLVFIIIIYVILIGPVIYLILKAVKQREKIWIAIPVISLMFVVFVALVSLGVRVRGLTTKSVTIHNLDQDTSTSYIFGYLPTPDEWSVKMRSGYTYGSMITNYTYDSSEKVDGIIKSDGDGDILTYNPSSTFETGCFEMTQDSDSNGYMDYDVSTMDDLEVTATVTNHSGVDYDYVLILYGNSADVIDGVDNGDSIDIDLTVGSNYYYGGSSAMTVFAGNEYEKGNYEKSGAVAALVIGSQLRSSDDKLSVIGVRRGDSITSENEPAWECYYSEY